MSSSPDAIRLSQWYACLTVDAAGRGASDLPQDVLSVGPLSVFRAREGAEIARFGPAAASAVIFDGYLFDQEEVARELGLEARAGAPDIVAQGYEHWSTGIFDRLDGCYLIAIWDATAGHLLLGHDAMGRHPAFYARDSSRLWFGGNVLALAASGSVPVRPNRVSLALTTFRYWPEAGETYFESIRRVRPGHFLRVTRSMEITEHRYWHPIPDESEPWLTDDYVREEFEPALERAVTRCMKLAPQGIMLSGGLDSVTVAALASKYGTPRHLSPLIAVSGRTGEGLSGEERMQTKVVEALGLPHRVSTTLEWRAGRDGIAMSLAEVGDLPGPTNIYWVGTYTAFYRRTAAEHLPVLLTGSGGDNWLGVADTHAADLLTGWQVRELLRFLKADMRTGGASLSRTLKRRLWASGIQPHFDSLWARVAPHTKLNYHRTKWRARLPAWLCPDPELRREVVERLLERRTPSLTPSGSRPSSYYRHGLRSASNPYFHHEFETGFHVSTACGLRLLSPYHDRRLVSFLNRISPRLLMHGGRYKGLLRPVAVKYLPHLGLEHQRKEYEPDLQQRQLSDLRASLGNVWPLQNFRALGELGVVDPALTMREGDSIAVRDFHDLGRLFGLISAEHWIRVRAPL